MKKYFYLIPVKRGKGKVINSGLTNGIYREYF